MKINRHKIFGIILFILLPFINQAQSRKDSVHAEIQGKWAWTETVPTERGGTRGGIKHYKTTPLTCKCERTLTINDNKIISHFSGNDSLIRMNHYELWHGIQDSASYSLFEDATYKNHIRMVINSNILEGDINLYGDTSMVVSWWVWDGGGTDYSFKRIK